MSFSDEVIRKMKKQYTFIDLFAGCGGLSEGFVQAGFKPIAHIEKEKDACFSLRTRSCYHYLHDNNKLDVYYKYLRSEITRDELYNSVPRSVTNLVINATISDETVSNLFLQIKEMAMGRHIDMIVGGPPCQAYSLLGRHRKEMENDPRTLLYLQYGKFLKEFTPKGFVFENVPGLLSAKKGEHFKNLQSYFDELGYKIYYKMLDASDYGVLQVRHRIIIVGWLKDNDLGYPNLEKQKSCATVNDLLEDLPFLKAGEISNVSPYRSEINDYLRWSGIRSDSEDFVTQNISRPVNSNDAAIYRIAINAWNCEHIRIKYTDLPEKNQTQKNKNSFLDRFKVVDGHGYAHTIVAHLAKDGHYYIHPSLDCCRSITVREAARLQSFPDNFYFEGSRSAMFKQIGNAVPVLMSKKIAESIRQLL